MLSHCSLACFSSRFLRDSTGILFCRCIVLLAGLAAPGDVSGLFCSFAPPFVAPHALHAALVKGLTRVQAGQGQPEPTALEPSKVLKINYS